MLWLRKRLRKNSKRSGANMVSMKDIAQRCGVSVAHSEQSPERPAGHWPRNQRPDLCSRRGDGLCDQLRRPGPEGHLQHRHPLRGRAEQRSDPCVFLLRAGKPEGGGREPGLRCDLHQPQRRPPHHLFAALPLPGCGRGDHRQCGFFRSPGAGAGEFRAACGHH